MDCEPELWLSASQTSKRDTKKTFDFLKDIIQWRSDGKDTIIDIGCATGDTINDVLLPEFPRNFTKILGVDIVPEFIELAKLRNKNSKIDFDVMDIGVEIRQPVQEQFDHATSFYCLNWIPEVSQQIVFNNLYKLLNPNGNCILTIANNFPHYPVYLEQLSDNRWSPYMHDVKQKCISSYFQMSNSRQNLIAYIKMAGFRNQLVNLCQTRFTYDEQGLRDLMLAMSPFMNRMPGDMQKEYLDDLCEKVKGSASSKYDEVTSKTTIYYEYFIVYAEK